MFPGPHMLSLTQTNTQFCSLPVPFAKTTLTTVQPVEHKACDKADLGALALFVFPERNVNNTRCLGEWLKLNTSPLSVSLASDPL